MFGDNGQMDYTAGIVTLLATLDTVAETGGDDRIDAGDGNNVVIAGVGNDIVRTGSGSDMVIGDNGEITNDAAGVVLEVITGDPLLGGNDQISTEGGKDLAIGGWADDTISGGDDNDILAGDGLVVTFLAGSVSKIMSIDVLIGGNDHLDGGRPGHHDRWLRL